MDVLATLKRLGSAALSAALIVSFLAVLAEPALAQTPAVTGSVSGSVATYDGAPISGAAVSLQGPVQRGTVSDARGRFAFTGVPLGTYSVTVTKAGFGTTLQEDVYVVAGAPVEVAAVLAPASFSSLRQIGRVSTNVAGRATINTTPAAVNVISNQVFIDQGQIQLTKILNETPGVMTAVISGTGSSQGSEQITQIRGALPYETASLIDGHPVSVGVDGSFSPTFLNPAMLQNVEIVKGPGATTTEINFAINGSVNYRTLEPTRTPQQNFSFGVDGFGGINTSGQATGSVMNHKLDYAFALSTNGTPSAVRNYPIASSSLPLVYGLPPWKVNGQVLAQFPYGAGASGTPQYAGTPGAAQFREPLYICCSYANAGYHAKSELAKLRFNFSQQTALTLSYLGGQSYFDDVNQQGSLFPVGTSGQSFSVFAPPAGYTGSVQAGRPIPFDTLANAPTAISKQENLLQAEFRTALGSSTTMLARFYTGFTRDFNSQSIGDGKTYSFGGNAWGGLLLCPVGTAQVATGCAASATAPVVAPVMTYFNNTPVTLTTNPVPASNLTRDSLRGYSVELDHVAGPNTYSLSFDRSHHDSSIYTDEITSGLVGYQLLPGSSQQFSTIMARAQLTLTPKLTASLSDYVVQYSSHYTNAVPPAYTALAWSDATQNANEPRLGLAWRPSSDVAVRFSAGGSIAPPYVSLLSSAGGRPVANAAGAATSYTLNLNNGQVRPETAFSYNLGMDKRFANSVSLSADVYLTNLHNLYLTRTYQSGTYTPLAPSADAGNTQPLFITQTQNLGQARYQGIEFALQRSPLLGLGFRLQGALTRAFTYELPAGFYATALGPYTANLGVLPTANFYGNKNGFFNGTAGNRVPYSSGYGELNYRTRGGAYYNLGTTYYGPNNGFNQTAFVVISGSARWAFGKNATIDLTGDNLTGSYDAPFASYFGGVPVPLANGAFGHATSGYLGTTRGTNYGPSTVRLTYRYHVGRSER